MFESRCLRDVSLGIAKLICSKPEVRNLAFQKVFGFQMFQLRANPGLKPEELQEEIG